ncbi:hypothetical protein ACLI4Q_08550 [Natrialbaceae archaeon A-CW1-1]
MATEYDKLVRDRIPAIIDENGDRSVTHVADDAEYERRLLEKLEEECTEVRDELSLEELEETRRQKSVERGGFDDRIVLERVHESDPL